MGMDSGGTQQQPCLWMFSQFFFLCVYFVFMGYSGWRGFMTWISCMMWRFQNICWWISSEINSVNIICGKGYMHAYLSFLVCDWLTGKAGFWHQKTTPERRIGKWLVLFIITINFWAVFYKFQSHFMSTDSNSCIYEFLNKEYATQSRHSGFSR